MRIRQILPFLLLLFIAQVALATHNRAGEIIYAHVGGSAPTYDFSIITYTQTNSPADRDSLKLEIYFAGATVPLSTLLMDRTSIVPYGLNLGVQQNIYKYRFGTYTFPGPGIYILSMNDPNRIADITNIPASVNIQFTLEDTIIIRDPQFFGYNSSPVLLENPIVFAPLYQPFTYNPGAYDPDGDSLTYELMEPLAGFGTTIGGYRYPSDPNYAAPPLPNNFTINRVTGDVLWDVPSSLGIFNVAIIIRDYREGRLMGTIIRDMQIIVVLPHQNPPKLSNVIDTCVEAGSQLLWTMIGTDPDVGQTLTMSATGGPFYVDDSPATFTSTPSFSPVTGQFQWNTNCSHISPVTYTVVFKVADDYRNPQNQGNPYSDIKSWRIRVVAPPVQNLQAVAGTNDITLSWDNYICAAADTFMGFTVWRKRGCDTTDLGPCFTGNLAALGYQQIAGPMKDYNYVDTDVSKGVFYTYRIMTRFAKRIPGSANFVYNQVSGLPSDPLCLVVNSDVPFITKVSVEATGAANGQIRVEWVPPSPLVLDTQLARAPYRVDLYRHTGFTADQNPTFLQSFTYNSYSSFAPDGYTDNGLNTIAGPYNYHITFFATDGANQFYEVGSTSNASSIYLTTLTSGNQLSLSWDEDVPWINYAYTILREQTGNPGLFDTIARVESSPYIDTGLVNGLEYCYVVYGTGSYFNPATPDSLINFSQYTCDIPMDTVPPCVPQLTVTNDCDILLSGSDPNDLKNRLRWTNPVTQCAEDAFDRYKVYYAPVSGAPLELIAEIFNDWDTFYTHDGLKSLAGCYVVTAVDTFGNESGLVNKVCVDNCPVYRLPNAFSPNGDGQNDLFTPFLPFFFVDKIDLKVFNRWGNLVFETTDPMINWDGTDINTGKALAESAYFYTCEVYEIRVDGINRLSEPLSGYIHLFRGQGQ